jgi:DNA invertase Pin-like site-specific DNA recombinase
VKVDEGIEQQVHHCRVVAEQVHHWHVVATYTDNDVSASSERGAATAWARMLADFEAGRFDVLMCTEVPRLLRRIVDVVELRQRGVRIVTARDGIDTSTPMGNTILTILVALAEAEIETKKARNVPFVQSRRAAGHPWPGLTPYGYRWVPDIDRDDRGTRWAVVPAEADVVRRMTREYLAGASIQQIAKDLNADGSHTRRGAKWGASTVRRMLLSPFTAGLLPPRQPAAAFDPLAVDIAACVPGAWDAIVTADEYLAARSRIEQNPATNNGDTARKWLLSGLAECGVCHQPIVSARVRTSAGVSQGYRCHDKNGGHFQRRADVIDEFVTAVAIVRLSRPDAIDLLKPQDDGPDLAVLHAHRDALQDRDAAIAGLIASGKMTPKAAEQALDTLAAELRAISEQIAAAVNVDPLADAVTSGDVAAWWEGATLARRRTVIEALFTPVINRVGPGKRVTLDNVSETLRFEWRVSS